MYLNKFIFPAPHSTYNANTIKHNLIWITRPDKKSEKTDTIQKDLDSNQAQPSSRKYSKHSEIPHRQSAYTISEPDLPDNFHAQEGFMRNSVDGSSLRKYSGAQTQRDGQVPDFEDHLRPGMSLEEIPTKERGSDKRGRKKSNRGCFEFFSKQKTRSSSQNKTSKSTAKDCEGSKSARLEREAPLGNLSSDKNSKPVKTIKIPCLYIPSRIETQKTVLYFHSNGEDLYQTYELLMFMGDYLHANVLAVEYPGYGIYKGSASEKKVLLDAEAAYNYIVNDMHVPEGEIIIAGRSLGSGPATWLASEKKPSLLILVSPFTSIRAIVKHSFGRTAQYFIKERFNNLERMPMIKCPVFILHGKRDTLIPHEQAVELCNAIKGEKRLELVEDMDHGSFDFFKDLMTPLTDYITELNNVAIAKKIRVTDSLDRDIFGSINLIQKMEKTFA